jgi:hypothetical protein
VGAATEGAEQVARDVASGHRSPAEHVGRVGKRGCGVPEAREANASADDKDSAASQEGGVGAHASSRFLTFGLLLLLLLLLLLRLQVVLLEAISAKLRRRARSYLAADRAGVRTGNAVRCGLVHLVRA